MIQEVHILIGCADARDLSQMQADVVSEKVKEYKTKGIHIDLEVLRVAGSFVTPDVVMDIKRTIERVQKETAHLYDTTSYYVHIQTHGHLDDHSNKNYVSHIYEMNIVHGSPLNCGMMGATGVGIEIEQFLLEEKLELTTPTGTFKVTDDEGILRLLREVYGYEGYLAGDWLKSIAYLRTHPREQKAILEKYIRKDASMSRLGIKITAGILDYSIHGLIRLDDGKPEVPFWDEVQLEIRNRAEAEHEDELDAQAEIQKPLAGLLSMSDPRRTSRLSAAKFYYKYKGIEQHGEFMPNTIFNMAGTGFDLPEIPFGPYTIGGFFYAVKHLHLTDQMVMGYDDLQTKRMIKKILNDPIMALIVKKFDVNLIPISQIYLGESQSDMG